MSSGFQPPCPGPSDSSCVMWFDFEELTPTNLWKDQSRNALHATPQAGFAAPAYGLGRSAKGKGYANFTGAANQYATLPFRFYDVAPTQRVTLVFSAAYGVQVANGRIFNARDATRGLMYYFFATNQLNIYCVDSGGVASQHTDALGLQYDNRTRVGVWAINRTALTSYGWQDGKQYSMAAVGNTNPIAYNVALVPALGGYGAGLALFVGRMYFLALFNDWFPNDREAGALSQYLRDVC
jgi:hypothetical protein